MAGLLEHKEHALFRGQRLTAVPTDVLTLRNLVVLDLSHNRLTRLPGALIAQDMPRLEQLHVHHNLLYVLEDVLALSVAARLRDLHVGANPLRLVENRVYLLEALFGAEGCDEKTLRMVHKDPTLTKQALAIAGAATKPHPTSSHSRRPQLAATAAAKLALALVYKLPRRSGFSMLQKLNGQWITDDDVHVVEKERGCAIEYYVPRHRTDPHNQLDGVDGDGDRQRPSSAAMSTQSDRRFDGSRLTATEMLKRAAWSAAVPNATVIQRFQIDVDTNADVTDAVDDVTEDEQVDRDECDVIARLFGQDGGRRLSTVMTSPATSSSTLTGGVDDADSWSYSIRTFDALSSEDRQCVRHRSKQSVESNLQRDDHVFDSSVFIDCVAQAERSRRLTIRAVDTLCPSTPTVASSSTPTASTAAVRLRQKLATQFSKSKDEAEYEKLENFLHHPPQQVKDAVSARDMQAALSELFVTEHMEQRRQNRQLVSGHSDSLAPLAPLESVAAQLDDSLSRTKLRNAVDLANAMQLNKAQEKRMMQMLIDADAKAIEHERAALDQALHRHRLDLIAANKYYSSGQSGHDADREWMAKTTKTKTPSPWQARNWRAKEAERRVTEKQQQLAREQARSTLVEEENATHTQDPMAKKRGRRLPPRPKSVKKTLVRSASQPLSKSTGKSSTVVSTPSTQTGDTMYQPRFRSIETVDMAAQDPLDHVSSRDLLVRCASIRQRADTELESLAQYRDRFLDSEAAWETMRQDPINIVRRHLRRKLYQDAQEIQIAGTQLFYSSLFQ